MFVDKTVAVTGAAGFLGSHLCQRLIDQGAYVIGLDNLYTGRMQNLTTMLVNKNFTFIQHDVINPIDLKVDKIFNLACPASPPHYQRDPILTTKTSVLGALNMLDLARKNDALILQASTSEVYGDPEVHPQVESYRGAVNPIGIRSCYDEGKRCAESLFFDYHRMYGVAIKVIRIFNTYGPQMDPYDGRVVSNVIMQALQGKPITIYGDGSQTRSFCYVDDLIDGMLAMMQSPKSFCGPVNLGNPHEFTIKQLVERVLTLTRSSSPIIFQLLPQDDPMQRKPDITLARQQLAWEPQVMLDDGLKKTIDYFKTCLYEKEGQMPL